MIRVESSANPTEDTEARGLEFRDCAKEDTRAEQLEVALPSPGSACL